MARKLYSNLNVAAALGAVAYDAERDAVLDGSAAANSYTFSAIVKNTTRTLIFWDNAAAHYSATWPNASTFDYSIQVTATVNISTTCTIGVYRLTSGGGSLVSSATASIDLSTTGTKTGNFGTATLSAGAATDVLGCYLLIVQDGSHNDGSITIADANTWLNGADLAATGPTGTILKRYNGATWDNGTLKYYDGSTWQTKPLKRYNGATWDIV